MWGGEGHSKHLSRRFVPQLWLMSRKPHAAVWLHSPGPAVIGGKRRREGSWIKTGQYGWRCEDVLKKKFSWESKREQKSHSWLQLWFFFVLVDSSFSRCHLVTPLKELVSALPYTDTEMRGE